MPPSVPSTVTPTTSRMRWAVMAFLFLLSFLTIVDRVAISAAKRPIAAELSVADTVFGIVFGAFAIGYALFMAPSGVLADRWGPRRFLTVIVLGWSLFTFLTGAAYAVWFLIAIRFLFGMAEAGAYPTAARAIHNWFPQRQRGLALGLLNTGSRLGAALGLHLVALAVLWHGWRISFFALGVIGCVWSAAWWLWFRDDPAVAVNTGESTRMEQAGNWRVLLKRHNAYLLVQYFAQQFTFFLCFSWLLPYLQSGFGVATERAGFLASIPLYCGAMATWISGALVDWMYSSGRCAWSRRLPAVVGFALAGVAVLAAARAGTGESFVLLFAIATFGVDLTLSPSWTTSSDFGGPWTGTLSAAMNTVGSTGAFVSSLAFPWLLQWTGSLHAYFILAAGLNLLAAVLWVLIPPPPHHD